MHRIRTLLVDDHAMVREALARVLRAEPDIEVVGEAADGRAGAAAVARLRPDVVTLDVAMPVLNGLDAARRIRAETPGTRILMLSAHEEDIFLERAVAHGVDGYFSKSASAESLAGAIRDAAAGRRVFSRSVRNRLARIERLPSRRKTPSTRRPTRRLSLREVEVLQLIAEGLANKQAAARLGISIKTVEKHRQKIMDKLQVHETAGLTRHAVAAGIIVVPHAFPRRPPPRTKSAR